MPKTLRLVLLCAALLSTALLLPAAQLAQAKGKSGRGPIADPADLGPWAVGRTTFQIVDPSRDDRPLVVDAWYPVDPEDAVGPPSIYDLIFTVLPSEVAFDAPPVSSAEAFPLVVFSHGSNGVRFQSFFLTEQLASHGFFVVAPEHAGNSAFDILSPGTPFETKDRPLDVSFLITTMLDRNEDPTDDFFGRVDPERIGVTGHSFGGFTAITMASGFEDVPPDPRVDAILPISPGSAGLSDEDLGRVFLPMLVLAGTADTVTPIDPNTIRPFELAPALPRYRVDVLEAGHNSFTDICTIAEVLIGAGLPPPLLELLFDNISQGCAPDLLPVEEAQRVNRLYAASFLKVFVTGDPRYKRYLTRGRAVSRDLPVDFFKVKGGPGPK